MIEKYDFKNLISEDDNLKCIQVVNNLLDNDIWCNTVPYYQTWPDLFQYPEFYKLKQSFIFSCFCYLNMEVDILDIKCWCFVNDYQTQLNQDRDNLWHSHKEENCKKISGIFYLSNPKDVPNYELSGTEFKDHPNIIPEDFSWFIYPSHLIHRPGKVQSVKRRYVIASDLYIK